jgi:hypothetical protein
MKEFPENTLLLIIGELYVKNLIINEELEMRRQMMSEVQPNDDVQEDQPDEPVGDQESQEQDQDIPAEEGAEEEEAGDEVEKEAGAEA